MEGRAAFPGDAVTFQQPVAGPPRSRPLSSSSSTRLHISVTSDRRGENGGETL